MMKNEENFMNLIWLPTTSTFSGIFRVRRGRIKGIKEVLGIKKKKAFSLYTIDLLQTEQNKTKPQNPKQKQN